MTGADGRPVRIVVADDSATMRRLLAEVCERDPGIVVVGEAADGAEVVRLTVELLPSLVLMDIHLPVLDGIEATKHIMRERPTPIIMMTAGTAPRDVEAGLSALRFGALTVLTKPVLPSVTGADPAAARLVSLVKALADVKVIRRRDRPTTTTPRLGDRQVAVLAVAASTGGPPAVCSLLQALPRELPVAVVVVQHIVEGFLPGLVKWLRSEVPFHVTLAEHGQALAPGTVYLAPDNRHVEVDAGLRVMLSNTDRVEGFKPSASVLFTSLARNVGAGATAVVLTGMGRDGLEGARALRAAGGRVLAQDEASSVVYGMPKAVADAGLAHAQGRVDDLAADIVRRWGK